VNGRGVFAKVIFPVIVIGAIVWLAASSIGNDPGGRTQKYTFSQLLAQARENPRVVTLVMFHPSTQQVEFRYADGTKAKAAYPVDESAYELQQVLESKHILFDAKRTGSSPWWSILTSLLPFVLLFGFWIFLMQQMRRRKGWGQTPSGSDPFGSSGV
jgi:ATP-dependent Zn protease